MDVVTLSSPTKKGNPAGLPKTRHHRQRRQPIPTSSATASLNTKDAEHVSSLRLITDEEDWRPISATYLVVELLGDRCPKFGVG